MIPAKIAICSVISFLFTMGANQVYTHRLHTKEILHRQLIHFRWNFARLC